MRSLLDLGLGIEVLGGHAALDRPVEGVCVRDLEDPTPWMAPGSLLLTTGPTLEADPDSGVRLVRLLAQRGMAGVGVAITPHVREVPAAMVAAADEAGLPLVTVPAETPLRLVTACVDQSRASADMHRLKRTLALQQSLVATLGAEKGIAGLVSRLGELLDLAVVLLDSRGRQLVRSSPEVDALVPVAWTAYRQADHEGRQSAHVRAHDQWVVFREVRLRGALQQVLLCACGREGPASAYVDEAVTFAQRLLEAELATRHGAGLKLSRSRSQVLERLLAQRAGEVADLAERMLDFGIDAAGEWRMVAFEPRPAARSSALSAPAWGATLPGARWYATSAGVDAAPRRSVLPQDALNALDLLLAERSRPFLSCRLDEQLLLFAPLELPADDLPGVGRLIAGFAETLRARLGVSAVVAGFSDAMSDVACVARAASQARIALGHCHVDEGVDVAVTAFDDLGSRYRLLESMPDESLERLVAGVLGRLGSGGARSEADLASTLHAFLAHGCSTVDTSAALYVHRNTLRKRLARIEELTGVSLASTGGLVEVYLSARAAEILATRLR